MGITGAWQKCLYLWEKDIYDLIAFLRSRHERQPNRLTIGVDVRIGMVRVAKSGSDFLLSHPTADTDALVDYYSFLAPHFDVLYVDDHPQPNPSKIISYSRSRELKKNRILAEIETVAFQTASDPSEREICKKNAKKYLKRAATLSASFVQAVSELPEYFRAPLQADPQLAYLLRNQAIDAIFSEDSDILALYAADFLIKSYNRTTRLFTIGSLFPILQLGPPIRSPQHSLFTTNDSPILRSTICCILGTDFFPVCLNFF
jgi:hypothetical protein